MTTTFISRRAGDLTPGTIILWYGTKDAIPDGWAYYSAGVDKLIEGALVADTTPRGNATHKHAYTAKTGAAGVHTHVISLIIGEPINATVPGHYAGGTINAYWAGRYHTNHTISVNVAEAPAHDHALSETGEAANLPASFGLYYIRKT